jgi:hypothetical protein
MPLYQEFIEERQAKSEYFSRSMRCASIRWFIYRARFIPEWWRPNASH